MVGNNTSTQWLTMREAAWALGVHQNTLRRWCDKGMLPYYRYGQGKERRFKAEDITDFINAGKEQ